MMSRQMARSVGAPVVGLLAALLFGTATLAADPPAETRLAVSFSESSSPEIPNYLVAQLTLSDGSAVADQEVTFLRTAALDGEVVVELGRAVTDLGGDARLPFIPRNEQDTITARYDGSSAFASTSVVADIRFPAETVERAVHAPNGGAVDPRLRPLASVMPGVLAGAVVLVWLVLLTVSVMTLWTVRSSGRTSLVSHLGSFGNEGREHGND
jgi:hypothetical protein